MGLSSALDWWEEWQLRILVLSSLFIQYLLLFSAPFRLYNRLQYFEDNELWTRHILTAVSQVTAAIYVFCNSWPGGDKRLLQAAILLFIPGVLKCLERPWALKNASISSLISSSEPAPTATDKLTLGEQTSSSNINMLENYVQEAAGKTSFPSHENPEGQENIICPSHLFVDIASSYSDRLCVLNSFRMLDGEKVYEVLQEGLSSMFNLFYTKGGVSSMFNLFYTKGAVHLPSSSTVHLTWKLRCGLYIRVLCMYLPFAAIGLYHKSHREAYNVYDVKVTYALLCCTAILEPYSVFGAVILSYSLRLGMFRDNPIVKGEGPKLLKRTRSSVRVSQYSLIGFFTRNKRHTMKMHVLSFLHCKDFLDQRWSMKPRDSSVAITKLVLEYVKKGWKDQITNVDSYWKFIDHRGQWTLQDKCKQDLIWSLRRPFDKAVILWHISTYFCFYTSVGHHCSPFQCNKGNASDQGHVHAIWCPSSPYHERAVRCKEMSNYMMYLLFINPEMLLPGTRGNLFMTANAELEEMLMDEKSSLEAILKDDKPSTENIPKGNKSLTQLLKGKRPSQKKIERGLVEIIITKMKARELPHDAENNPAAEGFINDAWKISKALLALDDEKLWEVIEGVWIEMMCFSASRCRGYLHAKSLGTGGELLTYVWLLLSHMGMETLPERMQRTELSTGGGIV